MKRKNKLSLNKYHIFIISALIWGLFTYKEIQNNKLYYLSGKNTVYPESVILGMSNTRTGTLEIDFGTQIAIGSPLIFGGAHKPLGGHDDAWLKIGEVGVTSLRRDLFIENEIPRNFSIQRYKDNIKDIQNPENWNRKEIDNVNNILKTAKANGMKNITIFSYAPPWLTHSKTQFGVPADWEVYEDIIRKLYILHRENIDYIEIWNEPNITTFLNVSGSGLTKAAAYSQIYQHAAKSIRSVDLERNDGKITPIGGPVASYLENTEILEELLKNNKDKNLINFISYHNYRDEHDLDLSRISTTLKKYGYSHLPFFITEWNSDQFSNNKSYFRTQDTAISFTGSRLINYLSNGVAAANYFSLSPINRIGVPLDDTSMGFYKWENNKAMLLPQGKTWMLMSKTLGLGNGTSKIMRTSISGEFNAVGFINANNEYGIVISNENNVPIYIDTDLNVNTRFRLALFTAYHASVLSDGKKVEGRLNTRNNKGNVKLKIYVPENSVVGIIVKNTNDIFHIPSKLSNL